MRADPLVTGGVPATSKNGSLGLAYNDVPCDEKVADANKRECNLSSRKYVKTSQRGMIRSQGRVPYLEGQTKETLNTPLSSHLPTQSIKKEFDWHPIPQLPTLG